MKQIGVGELILGKEEKKLLNQVINSNRLSYGKFTKKFEELFANEHDSKYGVFCSSGTSALYMALAALKEKYQWKRHDEIIVPATTFVATINIILLNDLIPVLVDVDKEIYNINTKLIENKITKRTKGIIPVHLFGLPADMDSILEIAKHNNLKVIEDSCECMFAKYKNKKVGSFGEIGCFSTYVAHFLVTGIGGFCISDDEEIIKILRSLMNHGRDSIYLTIDDDKNISIKKLQEVIAKRFNFIRVGLNFKATELEAAIGLGQFKQRNKMINRRKKIAYKFIQELERLNAYIQLPYIPNDRDHNFMMFPIVLKTMGKENLIRFLEKNNIETRDMLPVLDQPAYKGMFNIEDFPVSQWIKKYGFYIGCHQYITDSEVKYIIEKFYEFFRK